jgi:hypothetical protein
MHPRKRIDTATTWRRALTLRRELYPPSLFMPAPPKRTVKGCEQRGFLERFLMLPQQEEHGARMRTFRLHGQADPIFRYP